MDVWVERIFALLGKPMVRPQMVGSRYVPGPW